MTPPVVPTDPDAPPPTLGEQLSALKGNSVFKKALALAIASVARDILLEPPEKTFNRERLAWARQAIRDPDGRVDELTWLVLAAPAVHPFAAEPNKLTLEVLTPVVSESLDGWVREVDGTTERAALSIGKG